MQRAVTQVPFAQPDEESAAYAVGRLAFSRLFAQARGVSWPTFRDIVPFDLAEQACVLTSGSRVGAGSEFRLWYLTSFAAFHRRNLAPVHAYLSIMLDDPWQAEGATHEAFFALLRHLAAQGRDVPDSGPWMFKIVRAQLLLELARPAEPTEAPAGFGAADPTGDRAVVAALRRLPLELRDIVLLRHLARLSTSEVGELVDNYPPVVSRLSHRGLQHLAEDLFGATSAHHPHRRAAHM
jgi:DNA-directed RNA polymerase specialized sigma24 family protein